MTPERAVAIRCCGPFLFPFFHLFTSPFQTISWESFEVKAPKILHRPAPVSLPHARLLLLRTKTGKWRMEEETGNSIISLLFPVSSSTLCFPIFACESNLTQMTSWLMRFRQVWKPRFLQKRTARSNANTTNTSTNCVIW